MINLILIALILMTVALILTLKAITSTNKLIKLYREDNKNLRNENEELDLKLYNLRKMEFKYLKKITKCKNIIIKKEQNSGLNTDAIREIEKELFADANQDK